MAKRARPRRGRHLPPVPTADLLSISAEAARIDQVMIAGGFVRAATARPYLHGPHGCVTFRIVWRRRQAGASATFTETFRLPSGRRSVGE